MALKSLIFTIAKAVAAKIIDGKREKPKFTITCTECECSTELGDFFSKSSGDIELINGDGIGENTEEVITIQCTRCGNSVYCSGY